MKALISVSDKTGILEFAKGLSKLGIEIISTGGTAKMLKENKVAVMPISDYTGFPEIMDGRVKTLHPKVHGGLLALRDNKEHIKQAKDNNIEFIDLVVVNLYPFRETIAKKDIKLEDAVEQIDIGGPTMLRSSAKNFKFVTVVVDPADYKIVLDELKKNKETSYETRKRLAVKVFRHIADYDAAIDKYLSKELIGEDVLRLKYVKGRKLRYGENWHQTAMFYEKENVKEACLAAAKQLHGKELSFNNYVDGDAALNAVKEFKDEIAVSVIKHTNPCGLATGKTLRNAVEAAWSGDNVSAFGSVIAMTRKVDLETAKYFEGRFVEAIIAPGFDKDALEFLKNKSKNIMLLEIGELNNETEKTSYKEVTGGMLEQSRDLECFKEWKCVTKIKFPDNKKKLAEFAWKVCKHVKSNAILITTEYEKGFYKVLGMGAGQPNRVDSLRKLAVPKAEENLGDKKELIKEAVLASDAFFPFADSIEEAAKCNIKYIVQPGGSIRDEDVIKKADELGIAMVFTGMRHFMH